MKYLVGANILSEATRPEPAPEVIAWLKRNEADLAVDPIILGEIRFGVLMLPPGKKRMRLERWFAGVVQRIHCLACDGATGLRWAELLAALRKKGASMPIKDSLIAATALTHGLTVATRNRVDFAKAGVEVVDPFA